MTINNKEIVLSNLSDKLIKDIEKISKNKYTVNEMATVLKLFHVNKTKLSD